jgi:dienelactone hydrolase
MPHQLAEVSVPVILVVQEIFGVHGPHYADTARRFAKTSYLAIAPSCMHVRAIDKYG